MKTSLFDDPIYRRFATERPICTVVHLTLRRLLAPELVDEIFRQHADKQYERSLLFSALTLLMSGVVLGKYASVSAGYKKVKANLGVALNSVYEKLKRVEPETSRRLVQASYEQVVEVRRQVGGIARHDLPGYTTRILDGNHLSRTEHRLTETREMNSGPLPGKSLVVYSPRFDAVTDFFPLEDGHAQERSALDDVIETLEENQLWIADRNFCTLKFLYSIASKCGAFVIRQHGQLHGIEQGKLTKVGETETGIVYENRLQLPTYDGQSITVRRVVVHLFEATRDGEFEIALLTNLPLEVADAMTVAELYRTRWKIETAFLHMTTALSCEIKALCYPRAALFCFANALIAYNALSIVKGTIAVEHGREAVEMMSHYYMALEISEATDGMLIALPEENWDDVATLPPAKFADELREICRGINLKTYRKSVRGPKKPPPQRKGNKRTTHVSTKRILDKRE
jgi:IS4 transposase